MADHLRAVRKHWWLPVLSLVVAVGLAALVTARATPMYASTVTFYVAASTDTGTALQADEFAQRRINSYVGVLTSDRLADLVVVEHGIDLDPADLAARITAEAGSNTVILTATVTDSRPQRSLDIAEALATEFPAFVAALENTGAASSASVVLNVISGPSLNPEPVSPRETLNIGVGVLVGLAAGVALAIGREAADRTVRSTEALKAVSKLPALASIALDRSSRKTTTIGASDPRSPRSEAYRQLRTNLTFSAVGKQMKVILVSSAVAGEGKSTTATNLALVLAETGRPVLLIEADLRRPKVSDYLGVEGGAGLTNVLAGQADVGDVIQPWGSGGLHVLAAGTLPPNPSELLGSDRMKELMADLRERFDVIVLDTPPVLPVTDAAVASAHADSVVLVVRYAKTTREQVRTAIEALTTVEAPLAGVALNMVPAQESATSYGYHPIVPEPESTGGPTHAARKVKKWVQERVGDARRRPGGTLSQDDDALVSSSEA